MEKIEVCLEIMHQTDKAFLVSDDYGETSQWVPKSQIDTGPDAGVGDTVVMEMPTWLAEEKGFI